MGCIITEIFPLDDLTEKQREVLDLLLNHKTSKEIARTLGISPHTVDQRILHARQKLGASSRSQLAVTYRTLKFLYGRSIYEESYVDLPAIPLETELENEAERFLTLNDQIRTEEDHSKREGVGYRVVPEMFDGSYGGLRKVGAVVLLALLMIFVASGGVALFRQLSEVFSP